MHCRSTQTGEHIASIFAIGTLFILCNPDKIRTRQDVTPIGWQCQKWPMTLACGYGRPVPSNRFLALRQSDQLSGEVIMGCAPLIPILMCNGETTDFGAACGKKFLMAFLNGLI